jgi:anti-sigma factor RsiW
LKTHEHTVNTFQPNIMTHCPFQPLLTAYHDHELGVTARRRIDRHLLACPHCAATLADLRDLTTRIAVAIDTQGAMPALAAMHRAVDRAAGARTAPSPSLPLFRYLAPFGALAASILIIAGVWLLDTQPKSIPAAPDFSPVAVAPDWERVAVTLRAEPRADGLSDSPFSPRYAAIHWMLDSLASAPTEEKPWPLPKSF